MKYYFVLLENASNRSDGQPVFVASRTRRLAVKKAKEECVRVNGGRWVTAFFHRIGLSEFPANSNKHEFISS